MPVPPPPARLGLWERGAWLELKELVDPLRVYSDSDAAAFEQVVIDLAVVRQAQAALRRHGLTIEGIGSTGQPVVKARPEVAVLLQAQKLLWVGLARFGVSPSDRSRVAPLSDSSLDGGRRARVAEFA